MSNESAADARFFRRVAALETGRTPHEERMSFSDYLSSLSMTTFGFGGNTYTLPFTTSMSGTKQEDPENTFTGYAESFFKRDPIVFGVMQARTGLLSEMRFKYRRLSDKQLFGDASLVPLERPAPNMTTGEWLHRIEQHASLAGNAYIVAASGHLLRPDYVSIILESQWQPEDPQFAYDTTIRGYLYKLPQSGAARTFLPNEIVHFSPIPDPVATFRGMSWMQPIVREVVSDQAATQHKQKFFENAATPNLAIKLPESIKKKEQFEEIRDSMESSHAGSNNAWKTLYLAAGADVTVVGADMKSLDLKAVQGAYETRICVAARVPAVVAGVSEGMQGSSLNAGNFAQARRSFVDGWFRPYARSLCDALAPLVRVPAGAELWFDETDIGFMREDRKDAAGIAQAQAGVLRTLIDAGFEADAVVEYVSSLDPSRLTGKHTGLVSVQLLPPGESSPDDAAA